MDGVVEKLRLARNEDEIYKIFQELYSENSDDKHSADEIILESIKLLSDEEKVRLSKYCLYYRMANNFIICIENDELKLKIIEDRVKKDNFHNDYINFTTSVKSVKSDEIKLEFLKKHIEEFKIYKRSDYIQIIKSIKNDNIKLEALSFFDFKEDKYSAYSDIISTLESDENRIKAMELYLDTKNGICYSDVIASFKSDKLRKSFINSQYMGTKGNYRSDDIEKIILSFKSSASKIEVLNKYRNTIYDEKRKEILSNMHFEDNHERVIVAFVLKKLNSYIYKDAVKNILNEIDLEKDILSIDYNYFLEYISNFSDKEIIEKIKETSLNDIKKEFLLELEDSEKLKLLNKPNDDISETLKVELILSLRDKENITKELKKIDDDLPNLYLRLESDEVKQKFLFALGDSEKLNLLVKLSDELEELVKIEVIISLENEETKELELEKLNKDFVRLYKILKKEDIKERTDLLRKYYSEIKEGKIYDSIGLDEDITIGMEIECEGRI